MKRPRKNAIVATLCLDESDEIVKVLPGNARLVAHLPGEFKTFDYITIVITQAQFDQINEVVKPT